MSNTLERVVEVVNAARELVEAANRFETALNIYDWNETVGKAAERVEAAHEQTDDGEQADNSGKRTRIVGRHYTRGERRSKLRKIHQYKAQGMTYAQIAPLVELGTDKSVSSFVQMCRKMGITK